VIVANPRRVRLIAENDAKTDGFDAELLARLGRVDPRLLAPVAHRGEQAQRDLVLLRARAGAPRNELGVGGAGSQQSNDDGHA